MKPRKFIAPTPRDALKLVKDALGPDALILSNVPVAGGVEIVAIAGDAVDAIAGEVTPRPEPKAAGPQPWAPPRVDSARLLRDGALRTPRERARETPLPPQEDAPARPTTPPPQSASRPLPPQAADGAPERHDRSAAQRNAMPALDPAPQADFVRSMIEEIRGLRAMLEEQLAALAWSDTARRDPGRSAVMRSMLRSGFSPTLARAFCGRVPPDMSAEEALKWLHAELDRGFETVATDADIIDRGGVYALVGPTGVGKTTTAAKIAARCVVRHGADSLTLLTTDTYRIGAQDQLRIYGKILGVPVHAVKDATELGTALGDARRKHMVLIDTIGMSQRDRMVAAQVAMLAGAGGDVRRLLLLNAASTGDTLEDVLRAYRGEGLSGCILTKIDEAAGLAPALDVVIRNGLRTYYVGNGQRVPEDLHLANRTYLIHRALKAAPERSAFAPEEAEYPVLMAAGARAAGERR
jgi:flagellar biosynthesis protein FlhF